MDNVMTSKTEAGSTSDHRYPRSPLSAALLWARNITGGSPGGSVCYVQSEMN